MHKTTTSQLFRAFIFCLSIFTSSNLANSQSILFYEDFDVSNPVTSLYNMGDANLIQGPSPCGKASWGDTSDFNSTLVDFDASSNPSNFMAVNPQAPCGGFYTATVYSDTMDFSGMDSLQFSATYLVTNTLGWGPTSLQVILDNGTVTDTISSEFTSLNIWDDLFLTLDPAMIAPAVSIRILLGGGSGVGLDNIVVSGFPSTAGLNKNEMIQFSMYPNPVSDLLNIKIDDLQISEIKLIDISGKIVYDQVGNFEQNLVIPTGQFANGIYTISIIDNKGQHEFKKVIIRH